jgi:hypothetical protein
MRLKSLFIACYGSLLLIGLAGCKKTVEIAVDEKTLAPIIPTPPPGGTLEWGAMTPGQSFDVIFDPGLCRQKSPIHATYGHPAVCTVAPQQFGAGKEAIHYAYHIQPYQDGKPTPPPSQQFDLYIGPRGCPWCITAR